MPLDERYVRLRDHVDAALREGSADALREALRAAGAWLESGAVAELDDQRRLDVLADLLRCADRHLSQLVTTGSGTAEALEVIAWRRRLPDLVSRPWRLSPARHPDEPELGAVLSEIATRHQERYQVAHTDRGAEAPGNRFIGHALRLRQLRARRAELEARLRREAAVGRAARPLASGTLDLVRGALACDERFVDIVRVDGTYVAAVVAPDEQPPVLIGLGDATLIDQVAWLTRAAMEGPGRAATFRDIDPTPRAEADTEAPTVLAGLVVEPLLPHLTGCRRLRVAVDGALLHVPLGVLAAGSAPLLTWCAVDYVTGADGLAAADRTNTEPGPDVVLAAPDYDLGRTGPANPDSLFRPLDGTAGEAVGIAGLRPDVIRLTGGDAVKSRLRAVRSPRVLHLATHGYTLVGAEPDDVHRTDQRLRGTASELAGRYGNIAREPDLRNGLALAGANTWLEHGDPGPAAGTGLLTVADVTGLDLTATELVVLSACDTGIGEITAPDGHLSLRAAFLRAGAGAVVASLWKVPDGPTCDLMVRFYELLGQGHGPADALRTVQLERHAAGDPMLNWGAFVCYERGCR